MNILAIDSGLEKTGFAIFTIKKNNLNIFKYITSGIIKTEKKDIEKRLKDIYQKILYLLKTFCPKVIVLEQLFFFKNYKTIISVSQAQGVVVLAAGLNNIRLEYLTPLQIKQTITGYGNADKKSVQKMVKLILPNKINFLDDDESDAIACALTYCYLQKNNIK